MSLLSTVPFEAPAGLIEQARQGAPVAMAVAGAGGRVALESAKRAADSGLVVPHLVDDPDRIAAAAREIAWDISGLPLEAAADEDDAARRAVALARDGTVAAVMKGQVHTDSLMRAVVARETGLRGDRRMSHVFHMTVPGRGGAIAITDAAVNVAPSVEARLDILDNALALLRSLGNDAPKVAVLSATEVPIKAMPSSLEAAEIVGAARARHPRLVIDGPLALDVAISPDAVAIKGVDSPVAGQADLLLVPNIETGNALFKAMVCLLSATAAGLVVGARVPIVLTSRADPPEARLAATALAAIAARNRA